jgi:uncharacterized protein
LKIQPIADAHNWITKNLLIIFPETTAIGLIGMISNSDYFKKFLAQLLPTFETGIHSLKVEDADFKQFFGEMDEELSNKLINRLSDGMNEDMIIVNGERIGLFKDGKKIAAKLLTAIHADNLGQEIPFGISDESDGTKRLLDLIPILFFLLNTDMTVFIDEIDRSLHPTLIVKLLEKFTADTTTKGQLVVTTHESNLLNLEIFRQDEIWFAEKDRVSGGTHLYSLNEFKPRYDLDIRKGYLNGRFGAIPFLANLQDLKWQTHDAEEARV